MWVGAVLAIGAVGAVCLFHGFWALMACSDDSGAPDRSSLDRCWAYDSGIGGGWKAWAVYLIFAPLAVVVAGSLLALIARRRGVLRAVAIFSLALAIGGFFASPLLFGSPSLDPPEYRPPSAPPPGGQ
jgi:cytochrome bd-type quinol oxidase subunit 2